LKALATVRLVVGAAISAALVACTAVPTPANLQLPVAVQTDHTWGDPLVLANWQSLGGQGAQPPAALSSTEAFAAALAFNPQLVLARAQIEMGRAGVLVARQRANPVLTLSPERVINTLLGASPWVAAISLVWPVQTAGKRSLAIEQALASSDASLLNAANAVWTLRASVRGALCNVELATARRQLARDEFSLREDLAGRLAKQAAAGVVSNYEASRARLDSDHAAQLLRQSEADAMASRHDLAAITGLPLAEIERRKLGDSCLSALPAEASARVADAANLAVVSRLDLRAKLAEFRVADAAWRKEIARRTPDLNLGPGYTYDQGLRKITFTIAGELPIYSQNDAAIAHAAADRNRALAEVEILQLAVLEGVARSRDQLVAAEAQVAQANEAVSRTQELLDRDAARQTAGELDKSAVVLSRLALVVARSDIVAAQRAQSDAVAAFEAATQVPLVAPLFDGNAAQSLLSGQGAENGESGK
jgi:outer membrane protein, heavy metal efflux system